MKDKHMAAKIAFGISVCFMLCVIISVIIGAFSNENGSLNSTPDEVATDDEIITTSLPSTSISVIETIVPTEVVIYDNQNNYESYSEYEYDLVARTIYQEVGGCSEDCQWLVGSTILNLADERGGIENVVFDYNTFNVAYVLYDCTPSELSYKVATRVLSGDRDYNVKYFRTDYYHGFGTPYTNVDNVYFSTN